MPKWTPEQRLIQALTKVDEAVSHLSLLAREAPHTRGVADKARKHLEAGQQLMSRDLSRELSLPSSMTASLAAQRVATAHLRRLRASGRGE